jgi:CelD/BcsL family acetyltransferase involved in cellulose biosynthesis
MVTLNPCATRPQLDDQLWRRTTTELTFRLGEIVLYEKPMHALVYLRSCWEMDVGKRPDLPEPSEVDAAVDVLAVRSQPVSAPLATRHRHQAWLCYVPRQYRRYYVDLTGTFDGYLDKFSSKSRSTLRRKIRKFADLSGGRLCWKEYRSPRELSEFYPAARLLAIRTYQETLIGNSLPASEPFFQRMLQEAARGGVRAFLLFLDDQPAAYLYCSVARGVLTYKFVGYAPEISQHSPGTVLQYLVLERLFAEAAYAKFDFNEGEGPQKEFFGTGCALCADTFYFRPTLANRLVITSHRRMDQFSRACSSMLIRLGGKRAVKRFIRKAW